MEIVDPTTAGTSKKRRCDADHLRQLQEVRRDQVGAANTRLQSLQTPLQQEKQPYCRLVLLGYGISRLDHGPGGDHGVEISTKVRERFEHRHLGDRVEVATLVENEVDVSERLEPATKPALRLAHALRHGPDLPVVRAQQHHHPVGFTERVGAENDSLVVDDRHEIDRVFRDLRSLGFMALLPDEQIESFTEDNPDWKWSDSEITRTYEFEDFNESMGFVVRVALEAEKANHHPDIDIRWNKVTLTLSTHSEGGLTDKDLELATTADRLVGPHTSGS